MYHQQQQHQHQHLSSMPSLPLEKYFYQQVGDSGLILSTDAKPRLKWTPELHDHFVEAIIQLGGPDKATPKTIMRLMGIPGLTLYHLKSHLQKYRLSKTLQAQDNAVHAKNVTGCRMSTNEPCEGNGSPQSHLKLEPQINRSMHLSEALQMQIEVQRRLHEQLEVQKHLQLRIEAQGKYLQSMLEMAQEALANHSQSQSTDLHLDAGNGNALDLVDAEVAASAKTAQLSESEFISRASATKRVRHEHAHRHHQHPGAGDGSADSCLTACEPLTLRDQRQQPMLSIGLSSPAPTGPLPSGMARLGGDRGAEATARWEWEEQYSFLQVPSRSRSRRAAASDERPGLNVDLNVNGTMSDPRAHTCEHIDLNLNGNGSSWN